MPRRTDAQPASDPFAGANELSADVLVEQVVARNPTITQMTTAAAAAAARYPQAISLEDPMFGATISPRLFGSHQSEDGFRVEVSQKYPWPGKLRLRGQNAAAEAPAAGHDVEDTRLQLIESTRNAFADYYLAERSLVVSRESLRLLNQFHRNAETLFTTGKVPRQGTLPGRGGNRQAAAAAIDPRANASGSPRPHQHAASPPAPDGPLPPPPADIPTGQQGVPASRPALRTLALAQAARPSGDGRPYRGGSGRPLPGPRGVLPRLRGHGGLRPVLVGTAIAASSRRRT